MRFERFPIVVALLLTLSLATVPMFGQSLTTGNITGTVLDPSRAVIAGATVELKGLDTGSTASTTTNSNGGYSFGLLRPGRYQITVKQGGFCGSSANRASPGRPDLDGRNRSYSREGHRDG